MSQSQHTKAFKHQQTTDMDESVNDLGSQPEHPSDDFLFHLAVGRLDEANAQTVQAHLSLCDECIARFQQLFGAICSFAMS